MNKITKILVLWLALCTLLTALYTSAAWSKTNKLTLKLNPAEDSCVMSDYDFWSFTVSAYNQWITVKSYPVSCSVWSNSAANITLQLLSWLSTTWWDVITKDHFTFYISNVTVTWSLTAWSSTGGTFAQWHTVYNKGVKKIWIWSWSLALSWTIPWWTPSWTYTWEINIAVQY